MQNEFKLNIENFGPINEAKLDINNLNIVGGVNASGKSFSARLLFCIVTALSNEGKKINNQSVKKLFMDFINKYDLNISITSLNPDEPNKIKLINELNELFDSWQDYNVSYDYFNNFYLNFTKILENYNYHYDFDDLNKIKNVIESHENKFQYIISLLRFVLMSEFGIDQLNYFEDSNVSISMIKSNCKMEYNMHFSSDYLNIGLDNENQITCK